MAVFHCPHCASSFTSAYNRKRHVQQKHGGGAGYRPTYPCLFCGQQFPHAQLLHQHIPTHTPHVGYQVDNHLDGSGSIYWKDYLPPTPSIEDTVGRDVQALIEILEYEASVKRYAKCAMVVLAEYVKTDAEGNVEESATIYLRANSFVLTLHQDYRYYVNHLLAQVTINSSDFVVKASGWALYGVYRTELSFAKCNPIGGGCGLTTVYRQGDLRKIMCATETDDHMCFFRAVARHFVPSDDVQLLNGFVSNNFDIAGFPTPFPIQSIAEFEKRHSERFNFRINLIFEEDSDGVFYPAFVSQQAITKEHINLLLYQESSGLDGSVVEMHYVYVANIDKLLQKKYLRKKSRFAKNQKYLVKKRFICPNCLNGFYKRETMIEHYDFSCKLHRPQRILMEPPGSTIEFKNYNNRFKLPIIGFFDMESVMRPVEKNCEGFCQDPTTCIHKTYVLNEQRAGTYSFVLLDHANNIIHCKTSSSNDCASDFIDHLLTIEPYIKKLLDAKKPMELTPLDEINFKHATACHICKKPFRDGEVRVRDHDHLSGR